MVSAQTPFTKKFFDASIVSRIFEEEVCFLKINILNDFRFKPGQYVWVIIDNKGGTDRQAFSIADYSEDQKEITIIFNKGTSPFKKYLLEAPLQTKVKILGPFGQSLVFEKDDTKPLNFYAGGVGIAPFLALTKHHTDSKSKTKINLYYFTSKSSPKVLKMLTEYKSLNSNFSYKVIGRGFEFPVELGDDRIHCIVGSQEFVDYLSSKLKIKGVKRKDMVFEQFYPSSFWKMMKYQFQENEKSNFFDIRESILSKFILWMIPIGFIFSVISGIQFYSRGVLTNINIFTSVILLFLTIYWFYSKNIKGVTLIVTLVNTTLILYGLIFDPSSKFALFWLPLVPVLNFIFNGLRSTSWNILFLIVVYIYFALVFFGVIPTGHETLELINSLLSTTLIVIMIYINSIVDNLRSKHFQDLIKKTSVFRQAIESSSNHIVITDKNGLILFANKAAQKITGFDYQEMVINTPRLWGGEMDDKFYKTLWHSKINGEDFEGEITNRKKDGSLYTALAHISPIKDNEEILGYIGTEEDISKLKELDKLKDEFVSLASHELRTPMTAIKGFVSMILDGDYGTLGKEIKEPLKNIQVSTERLINLVNDLLNVSRIESGRMKIDLSDVDIVSISEEALNSLGPIAESKKIKLKINKIKLPLVQTDPDKFKQVLINLVGNSIKFTDKGSVQISYLLENDFVKVSVVDTGIGIAKEDQQRMFGKFEQITSSNKGKPQGTGLGLYISKMIIEKQGGTLWIEKSDVGKGSIFSFKLPLAGSVKAKESKKEIEAEALEHKDQKDMATTVK